MIKRVKTICLCDLLKSNEKCFTITKYIYSYYIIINKKVNFFNFAKITFLLFIQENC